MTIEKHKTCNIYSTAMSLYTIIIGIIINSVLSTFHQKESLCSTFIMMVHKCITEGASIYTRCQWESSPLLKFYVLPLEGFFTHWLLAAHLSSFLTLCYPHVSCPRRHGTHLYLIWPLALHSSIRCQTCCNIEILGISLGRHSCVAIARNNDLWKWLLHKYID